MAIFKTEFTGINMNFPFFKIVFLLSFFSFSSEKNIAANDSLKLVVNQTLQAIYNFEFNTADSLIQISKKTHGAFPETHLLITTYHWWLIVSGEDNTANRKKYKQGIESALELLNNKEKKQLTNEDIGNYINAYAYKTRMELFNHQIISGFVHLNNCIGYLKKSFEKETEYELFYFTSGLYNYFSAYSAKEYPYLLPYLALHPKGNKEKGLLELFTAYKSNDVLIKTEANYFLMKIFYERENDYSKAEILGKNLSERYPGNLVYHYYYYTILFARDKKEEALLQIAKLTAAAESNTQLSTAQKTHFIEMARDDLKTFLVKEEKTN